MGSKTPANTNQKSVLRGMLTIWTRSTTLSKVIGVFLIILASFSFVQTIYFSEQQRIDVECQTEFVQIMSRSLEERGGATRANEKAIDDLFYGIRDSVNDRSRETLDDAFAKYEETRQAVVEKKKANPYPNVTLSERCSR